MMTFDLNKRLARMVAIGARIQGFLSLNESFMLYFFAKDQSVNGRVVEIGSFCGRSTYWLASGVKDVNDNRVIAIDHHKGSPEHHKKGIYPQEGSLKVFNDNMDKVGLTDWVETIVDSSEGALNKVNDPIKLIFIDGDHSYESVKFDYYNWLPKVVDGGCIILHDTTGWDGPKRLSLEIVAEKKYDYFFVDSMMIIKKVTQNGLNNS